MFLSYQISPLGTGEHVIILWINFFFLPLQIMFLILTSLLDYFLKLALLLNLVLLGFVLMIQFGDNYKIGFLLLVENRS